MKIVTKIFRFVNICLDISIRDGQKQVDGFFNNYVNVIN